MTLQQAYATFMQKVSQRPLPNSPMARIHLLAKELAEGASIGLWQPNIGDYFNLSAFDSSVDAYPNFYTTSYIEKYLSRRWEDNRPNINLLQSNGYVSAWNLTKAAFDLLNDSEFSTVFISYKRSESSAFALLVNTRLKTEGINSYLDMAIPKGDDWQQRIKSEIENHDYFVFLLGKQSLSSDVVRQELTWATQFGKVIIPIWHNGYEYKSGEFPLLLEVDEVLKKTNAIRVLEESALAYNNAIVELLNRFGITP